MSVYFGPQQLPADIDEDETTAAQDGLLQQQAAADDKADAPKAGQCQADVEKGDDAGGSKGGA